MCLSLSAIMSTLGSQESLPHTGSQGLKAESTSEHLGHYLWSHRKVLAPGVLAVSTKDTVHHPPAAMNKLKQ